MLTNATRIPNGAVEAQQVGAAGTAARSWGRLGAVLAALVFAIGAVVFGSSPAQAATRQWYQLPGYGTGTGYAIIDASSSGYVSSSASGRVQVTARSYCVKIQYAPYAYAALDGGWNNTPWNCTGGATKTFSWSDSFRLGYNGFKFRICTTSACGAAGYISF